MTSQAKPKHRRWVAASDGSPSFFPTDKYQFSKHLTDVGDFIRTHPIDAVERKKFRNAAYFWAWRKKWRVSIQFFRVAKDKWEVECTLVSKVLLRDFT